MYQIPCPNCGSRTANEFHFGGEVLTRPTGSDRESWADYLYRRDNKLGIHTEWWFHRLGCRRWFLARRHTGTNQVTQTFWPEEKTPPQRPLNNQES